MAKVTYSDRVLKGRIAAMTGRGRNQSTSVVYDVTIAKTPYPDRPDRTTAQVALYNEYGTTTEEGKQHVPPRPFFSQASHKFRDNRAAREARLKMELRDNDYNPDIALRNMAEYLALEVKDSIEKFSTPPNADSTIAKKGFDDPLVDTGLLKDSVIVVKVA